MLKAVIFDRDGVIVDSENINICAAIGAFKKLHINITEKEKNSIIGRHPADYCTDFLKKYRFSISQFLNIQSQLYLPLLKNAELFQEVAFLIKKLHAFGMLLAVATSSSRATTLSILNKGGLTGYFNTITAFEDSEKRKPDPDLYLITAEKLGVNPDECVAIEDTSFGLEAAKKAGMRCIIIANKYSTDQDFSKADLIVRSAEQITINSLARLFE